MESTLVTLHRAFKRTLFSLFFNTDCFISKKFTENCQLSITYNNSKSDGNFNLKIHLRRCKFFFNSCWKYVIFQRFILSNLQARHYEDTNPDSGYLILVSCLLFIKFFDDKIRWKFLLSVV